MNFHTAHTRLMATLASALLALLVSQVSAQTRPSVYRYPTSGPSVDPRSSVGEGDKLTDAVLDSKAIRGLYSWPARAWMESLHYAGRPSAKLYAYGIFEAPEIASSFVAGGPAGVGAKVTKDAIFEVAAEYIDHPEKVTEGLADAMMKRGLEAYRRNYDRYKDWKSGEGMSARERDQFVQDFRELNYYALGKELWGDVQQYKHKAGKYQSTAADTEKLKSILKDQLAELAKVSEAWDVVTTAERVKEVVDAAKSGLADYPPYAEHLERVERIESTDGFELPFAYAKPPGDDASALTNREPDPVFQTPPPRPRIEQVYRAIELGNAEEVWSHVYYKTADINGGSRHIPWLHYALQAEAAEREKRLRDRIEKEFSMHLPTPEEQWEQIRSGSSSQPARRGPSKAQVLTRFGCKDRAELIRKLYNLTKSKSFAAMIAMLIKNGADVNKVTDNRTPLGLAVERYNLDAIHLLVEAGADVRLSHRGDTVLELAARSGDLNLVQYLLSKGARPDRQAFLEAVRQGNHKLASLLLTNLGGVNFRDQFDEYAPLHHAIKNNDLRMFVFLLSAGADPLLATKRNGTAFEYALSLGRLLLARNMLTEKTKSLLAGAVGEGLLLKAVERGDLACLRFLLDNGAHGDMASLLRAAHLNGSRTVLDAVLKQCQDPSQFVIRPAATFDRHSANITGIDCSPVADLVVSADWRGNVLVWEWDTRRVLGTQKFERIEKRVRLSSGRWTTIEEFGWETFAAFVPDGSRIVMGASSQLYSWNWRDNTRLELARYVEGKDPVSCIAVASDGQSVLVTKWDSTFELRSSSASRLVRAFSGHAKDVIAGAISPDGDMIVSGACDNSVRVWEASSGKALQVLQGHGDRVTGVAFAPDGRMFASCSWDKTIRLWDRSGLRLVRSPVGHTGGVNAIAFSPDGKYIASAGADGIVRVWTVATGDQVKCFIGHAGGVGVVAFSRTGNDIISSSGTSVYVWRLSR